MSTAWGVQRRFRATMKSLRRVPFQNRSPAGAPQILRDHFL